MNTKKPQAGQKDATSYQFATTRAVSATCPHLNAEPRGDVGRMTDITRRRISRGALDPTDR